MELLSGENLQGQQEKLAQLSSIAVKGSVIKVIEPLEDFEYETVCTIIMGFSYFSEEFKDKLTYEFEKDREMVFNELLNVINIIVKELKFNSMTNEDYEEILKIIKCWHVINNLHKEYNIQVLFKDDELKNVKVETDFEYDKKTVDEKKHILIEYNGRKGILTINPFLEFDNLKYSKYRFNMFITNKLRFEEIIEKSFEDVNYGNDQAVDNLQNILKRALTRKASDIYIFTNKVETKIQFRIDEINIDEKETLTLEEGEKLRTVITENSGESSNKIGEIKGKITQDVDGKTYEFRVSVIPTVTGFSISMRILANEIHNLTLEKLGFYMEDISLIKERLRMPHGMIFVTGATGSGKTTSLACILDLKNREISPNCKVITIEDPVEIFNPNFVQMDTNTNATEEDKKFNFSDAIKSMLRQKPDVILVGETRDKDTLSSCVNAGLTGHLTFTTLHSNNVKDTITRLKEMGMGPVHFESVRCIVSQKLVGKLCSCKIEDFENSKAFQTTIYKKNPDGCHQCKNRNIGINGKIVIYEIATLHDRIQYETKDEDYIKHKIEFKKIAFQRLIEGVIDFESYKLFSV